MISQELLPATSVPSETDLLRQQLMRAQRLSSVGTLASSVAHEFNNILTTIINYAKLGQKPNCAEESRLLALDKILKAGQRAAVIVNGMLGFARNQSILRETVDLVTLIEDVLVLCDKDLAKHQVQVEKRFHGRPKAPIVRGQIEQILLNLIINARQAMPKGGKLTLDLRDNIKTDMTEIHICDTGVGIPPEQLRLIFDPFFTTKDPDGEGQGGTGLGLSVCRQIIEQHHGRIRVESVIGKGSRFTVKLPRRLTEEP